MDIAPRIVILDVTDDSSFGRIPLCVDPGFDHRSCDYWEDPDRGSRAARLDWLQPTSPSTTGADQAPRPAPANPFLADLHERAGSPNANPFLAADDGIDDNPFAPRRPTGPAVPDTSPRKLRLLARGLGVVGSYAKVLMVDDEAVAYMSIG